MVHGLSLGAISWRPYKIEKEIFHSQCSLQLMLRALIEMTMIVTVAVVCFLQYIYIYKEITTLHFRKCGEELSKPGSVENFFSSRTSSSTRQVGFKPRMPLPSLGPADERHQTLLVAGKKDTCATLSKAVNVLSHNSQARDLGVCLCGKALAGHGGTSIISACLPGGACVEITAPINKQSPSVEIFIQTELHPCGGLSEHSSCTLKGYSESHEWASTP